MIWQSTFLISVIDVAMVMIVAYAARMLLSVHGRTRPGPRGGRQAILSGLTAIALFHLGDLFIMHALPLFMPRTQAMAILLDMQLNLKWIVMLFGIGAISFGYLLVNRQMTALTRDLGRELAERKRTEIALDTSEERFEKLFLHAEVSIWSEDFSRTRVALERLRREGVTDLRSYLHANRDAAMALAATVRVIEVNEATLKLFGANNEPAVFKTISSLFGPGAIDVFIDELCAIWEKKQAVFRSEAIHTTSGGKELTVIVSMPIPVTEEEFRQVPVSIVDITDHVRAESALRDSERKFRTLTVNSPVGMFLADAQGNTTYNNTKSTELMGISMQRASDLGWVEAIHPDDREGAIAMWRTAVGNADELHQEVRWLHRDGEIVWTAGDIIPVRGNDGKVSVFIGTLIDITARKQAETALHDSEEKFRTLTVNAPVGMFLEDPHGNSIYVNDKCAELMGISAQESLGRGWVSAVHPDDRERVLTVWSKAVAKAGEFHDEFRWLHANGKIVWTSNDIIPVRASDGEVTVNVGILTDITERKQAEAQLRHAQRMEAVGQLTGGVAHDFNNLLAIMLGNTELLELLSGGTAETQHYIEEIKQAVHRGSSLTQRLLAFSRRQILSPVSADVTGLIDGLQDMLERTLGETIDLGHENPPTLWPAMIDPHQFENALINLAVNARDAMPDGGGLVIETANVTLDQAYAESHDEVSPGDYVVIAVSDAGAGMSPEVLEHVFDPFFTTKEVGKGSGLGLSMVYGFVKQSHGHISINSEVGLGTTVKLYLPRSRDGAAETGADGTAQVFAPGSERILVVEDDPNVRAVSAFTLRNQGYEVTEALDATDAIARLKTGPPFDLLFTDVILPGGMNGVDIATQAKHLQPGIKIIFTTGYTENSIVDEGKLQLGVNLITKPYRREELLEKVQDLLDGQSD